MSWVNNLTLDHPDAREASFEKEQIKLFRLDQDPSEKIDLAKNESYQAAAMLTNLQDWHADTQRCVTSQSGGWPR